MKIIGWILIIYLVYRIAEYMFAAGRRSVDRDRKSSISGRDIKAEKNATDDDGEYIDYKEIK